MFRQRPPNQCHFSSPPPDAARSLPSSSSTIAMSARSPNSPGSPPGSERNAPTSLGLGLGGGSSYAQVPSSPTSPYTPPPPNNGAESPGHRTSPPDWGQQQQPTMNNSNGNQGSTSSRNNLRFVSSPLNPHHTGPLTASGSRTQLSSWGSSRPPSDVSDMTDHDLTRGIMTHSVGGQYGPYTVCLSYLALSFHRGQHAHLLLLRCHFYRSISGLLTHTLGSLACPRFVDPDSEYTITWPAPISAQPPVNTLNDWVSAVVRNRLQVRQWHHPWQLLLPYQRRSSRLHVPHLGSTRVQQQRAG